MNWLFLVTIGYFLFLSLVSADGGYHQLLQDLNAADRLTDVNEIFARGMDPSAHNNMAIRWASMIGDIEGVKRLMKDARVDPSALGNDALRWAVNENHLAVVIQLLTDKRVKPQAALLQAARGRAEILKIFLQDSRFIPSRDIDQNFWDWVIMSPLKLKQQLNESIIYVLLNDDRIYSKLPDGVRRAIASLTPNSFLDVHVEALCAKAGIRRYSLPGKLLSIAVHRRPQKPGLFAIFSKKGKQVELRYQRALANQVYSLWKNGQFREAFDKIDQTWNSWVWILRKFQVQFKYHPKRVQLEEIEQLG